MRHFVLAALLAMGAGWAGGGGREALLITASIGADAVLARAASDPPAGVGTGVASSSIIDVTGEELGAAGARPVDGAAEHEREVRNVSGGPISIRVVTSTCPCLRLMFDKTVAPGGSTRVRLAAPVIGTPGEQAHWATFEASAAGPDGTVRTARFQVGVRYEADLTFFVVPEQLWIFAVRGVEVERRVYVRSLSLDGLNVRAVRVEPPILSAALGVRVKYESEVNPGEEALPIVLRGLPEKAGLFDATLVFETSEARFPVVRVPVQMRAREFWVAEPAGFALIIAPGEAAPIRRTVKVFSRDGAAAPAVRAEIRDDEGGALALPGARVSVTLAAAGRATEVVLDADPSALAECGVAQVVLLGSDGQVVRSLPLAWVKRKP
ncbi:MAG: hypothetical protein JNK35_10705 [Phycisphaerae bacterium]|nr:hypothetical protein [Phycisphaerae bacterium]